MARIVGKAPLQGKGFFDVAIKCYESFSLIREPLCDFLADHMCERSREDSGKKLSMLVQNMTSMSKRVAKKISNPAHLTRIMEKCRKSVQTLLTKSMLTDFELVLETLGNQFKLWRLIKEKEHQMDSVVLYESHSLNLDSFDNSCSNDAATQFYDMFLSNFARLDDQSFKPHTQKIPHKRTLHKFWLTGTAVSFPPQKAHVSQVELYLKSNIQIWKESLFEAYNNDLGLKQALEASYRNLMSVHATLVTVA